jgi:magnesium chelatase family protein
LPEFKRTVLEVMRQPLEERRVTISRARWTVEYPASFMLVASMNPCPCGYYNHPDKECVCGPGVVERYLSRISGPLLDRIDIHIEVTPVGFDELTMRSKSKESSDSIRERVQKARTVQQQRYEQWQGVYCNAQLPGNKVHEVCGINQAGQILLKTAMQKLNLSARAYDRILKVSRTIADMAGSDDIQIEHLAEAIHYRSLDRQGWGA